jgi:hypothetical protein
VVTAIQALKQSAKRHDSTGKLNTDVDHLERETEELLERFRKQNNQSEALKRFDPNAGDISGLNS